MLSPRLTFRFTAAPEREAAARMATKQAVFLINISILTINENTLFLRAFWGVFADSFVRFAKGRWGWLALV
jgi:hypothetical protein